MQWAVEMAMQEMHFSRQIRAGYRNDEILEGGNFRQNAFTEVAIVYDFEPGMSIYVCLTHSA